MKKNFDFIGKRKVFFIIPIVIAVITIITAFILGVPVDIEFKGGTMLTYSYTGDIEPNAVKKTVEGLNLGTVGVVLNFLFGIFTTRLMTMSLSRFKVFRKPALYGGKKAERSGN